MENYYKTLGVEPSSQQQEIKKAYFELAKKYHPDAGNAEQIKRFYEIAEAYKTLSDADLKKAYDATLEIGMEQIKTAEEELISKNPPEPNSYTQKRDPYRDEELKEFHRNRLRSAVFRVVFFTLFHTLLGAFLALLLKGNFILGAISGLMIGFSHSIRQNFDLETFFDSSQKRTLFRGFVWLILMLGALYFVLLISKIVLG